MSQNEFQALGIEPHFLSVLTKGSISTPSPIQEQCIPEILLGHDVLGIAKTGTGKTLAFVLPLIQNLKKNPAQVLIIAPTRELAYQINNVCKEFIIGTHLYTGVIVGGEGIYKQISEIKRGLNIIIATPGRLIDHLKRRTVNFSKLKYLVLDEADRLFDMGFSPQIEIIMKSIPKKTDRQTLLFSATMPEEISNLVKKHMHEPVSIEITKSGDTATDVRQEMLVIDKKHHLSALIACIKKINGTVLIFSRTKRGAGRLVKSLRDNNYHTEELHSDRSLSQRKQAIFAIKTGKSKILVATDIAARGIDIKNLDAVINYDLPDNPEDYIHRIGRTGRAGQKGKAISLVISDQGKEIKRIQNFINTDIEPIEMENVPSAKLQYNSNPDSNRRGGFRPQRRSFSRPKSGSRNNFYR